MGDEMSFHRQEHPDYVEGCIACKVMSLSLNDAEVTRINDARDKVLTADLAAYKTLRQAGLQPPQINGSANWARLQGVTQDELTLGRIVPPEERARVSEAMAISKEMGLITEGGRG
jgi:hypothetical protein